MVDIKQPPYFGTFDEAKKYYRILSRPGRPIQTREWNDLQSQIQNQIEKIGTHLFENGAQVLPGTDDAVTYRNNIGFIKIPALPNAETEDAIKNLWLGKVIVSTSAPLSVKARVVGYRVADTLGEVRLFVDYTEADATDGIATTFIPGQAIQTEETIPSATTIAGNTTSVGKCSAVLIKQSVYFFNGDFILVDEQKAFIAPSDPNDQSAWTTSPTVKVGLSIIRSVVTFQEDESLGDNANPSENFGAPGCDRLRIEAVLQQRDYNEQNDGQFIELLRVLDGVVLTRVRRTEYNVLQDTMARRTYDESGHYTVREFPLNVRAFLKEGTNGGVHPREEFLYKSQSEAEAAGLLLFGVAGSSLDPDFTDKWLPASSFDEFLRLAHGKLTLQIDPGKAYVKGYEIEKLAPAYVDIDRARSLRFQNNRTVSTNLGPYIFVTNPFGAPQIEQYETVEIHKKQIVSGGVSPGDRIGTAKILAIEYFSGTQGDLSAVYKLFLFDVNADSGLDFTQMKSVVSTSGLSFSADIVLEYAKLDGSVTPDVGSNITGFGTSFVNKASQKVSVGDYIRVGNDNSQVYGITAVNSDVSLTLDSAPTFTGNQVIEIAFASFQGLQDPRGLVFSIPNEFVYTIRSANADNSINDAVIDTFFSIRRSFLATSNGSGVIEIQTTLANEEFEDFSPLDYIAVDLSSGDWIRLTAGTSFNGGLSTAGVELVSATQVRIHANPAGAGTQYYIIATVRKTEGLASKEKSKTAIRGKFVAGSYSGPFIESVTNRSDLTSIGLDKADILKVSRIVMAPDFGTAPSSDEVLPSGHRDITERFDLDNGQRDYFYGIGAVFLKPGAERPTGRIRVEFDYFEHSSQGSYFSVDSYPFKEPGANMDYAEIPLFTDSSGRTYHLRDSLDFRPRLSTSGAFTNYIEVPRSNVRIDFHHYLNRIDILFLDRFGVFRIVKGTPDIDPLSPEEPGDSMSLYELDLQAYTATPEQCFKRKVDNRRFTMRDIGKLGERITNLEYYSLLTLVEKEAKELEVRDAQGLDRFKNGFIVDNFKNHGIGNIQDADYKCSVDSVNEEVRPQIHQEHAALVEKAGLLGNTILRDQVRSTNKYTRTGKLYTLPYDPAKFIEQELASQVENVNPYAKFTFRGRIKLDPSTDSWRDTETLPVLEVNDDSAFLAAQAGVNPNTVIWGEWEKNWTKTDISKKKIPKKTVSSGPNKPDANHSRNWPRYVQKGGEITTTTTSADIRKGLRETVVDKGLKTQSLGQRVVSTIAADYMRTRDISVEARGFMPNAVLYPFFGDESVSASCNPNNLGFGQPIRADGTGSVDLVFSVPAKKFLTGERIFKLTTSPSNEKDPQPASEGEAKYYAVGWVDQIQETELAIRQFEVQRTEVDDIRINVDVKTEKKVKVVREDPIAQSFVVQEKGGCFLVAVDVFFYSKDPNIPVKLQLRPLSDSGLPTNFILPFGEVVKSAADVVTNTVDLSNGKMTVTGNGSIAGYTVGPWDGATSNPNLVQRVAAKSGRVIPNGAAIDLIEPQNDMIPTRFIFESPVYVQEGNDYAIVLLADSVEYQVWVSQAGPITARPGGTPVFGTDTNTIIGTTTPILKDNFINGVFFRSSNGITWNPDQLVDMKFALHKANFLTNDTGQIEYVNDELDVRKLEVDPIQTFAGTTKVRVGHPNHGHPAFASPPPRVVISGATVANGIDLVLLNRVEGWPIESIELDSYILDISGSALATSSGRTGGTSVTASENRLMDALFFNVNQLTFPETEIDWSYSSTNGGNVSYSDPKAVPFVVNPYKEITHNGTIEFSNPMTISSKINENNAGDAIIGPSKVTTNGVGDRKSLGLKAVIRSFNSNLSPVLDADRLSVIAIANRLNAPSGNGIGNINASVDTITIFPTVVTPAVASAANKVFFHNDNAGPNKGKLKTDDSDVAQHLSKLDVGKLVTISGTTGSLRNCTDIRVLDVSYTPGESPACAITLDTIFGGSDSLEAAAFTLTQKDNFVDEIAPEGGSAAFKYITKKLSLARASTALHISFDAYRHESQDLELYYKILRADSKIEFDDISWTRVNFTVKQGAELVPGYPAHNSFNDEMSEYSATVNSLPPFLGFALKLVGKGGNSAKPPRASNLKGIALDE